jgi:hypothetical protein
MNLRRHAQKAMEALGWHVAKVGDGIYSQDGLWTIHSSEFMRDASFRNAYQRGVKAAGSDYRIHWRAHIALWAAFSGRHLEGDFVECGVNRGFLSSAIMRALDWDSLGKMFYLLDTFGGLDGRYVSEAERRGGALERNAGYLEDGFYVSDVAAVKANFSEWKNVCIVQGPIPDTLPSVRAERVAYLHIDMNCAPPEVAAMNFFWDRLTPGAVVLLDDYAYAGYGAQKAAMDDWARGRNIAIASLPTGQGLVLKTPTSAAGAEDAT